MRTSPEAIAAHTVDVIRQIDAAPDKDALANIYRAWTSWAASNSVAKQIREHIRDKCRALGLDIEKARTLSPRSRAMAGEGRE